MKFFAGIGSRKTPKHVQRVMSYLAKNLSLEGYILRSGAATGADQAFQRGVLGNKAQIWLPWIGFQKEFTDKFPDHEYRLVGDYCTVGEPDDEAWDSVEKFHPRYKSMEKGDSRKFTTFKNFMSRNYRQVRGLGEPDSEFIICWTEGGLDKGGTAQALRIARHFSIPIFNLFNMNSEDVLKEIEKLNLLY